MTHDEFTIRAADLKLRHALLELRAALLGRLILGNVDRKTAEHSTQLIAHMVEVLSRHWDHDNDEEALYGG